MRLWKVGLDLRNGKAVTSIIVLVNAPDDSMALKRAKDAVDDLPFRETMGEHSNAYTMEVIRSDAYVVEVNRG